jgi:hypothetical protein
MSEIDRIVKPEQVAKLVQWDKVEACIIMCKGKKGESNHLVMSSVTVEELSFLVAQLNAHLTGLLVGSLNEGLPNEGAASGHTPTN